MLFILGSYVGKWQDNKKHGKGRMTYANGAEYEGDFVMDIRHGKGKIVFNKGSWLEESYEGDWVDDQWHGQGTYRVSERCPKYSAILLDYYFNTVIFRIYFLFTFNLYL